MGGDRLSKFEGTVEDIVFRNDQNGWTVAAVKLDGDRSRISAVGVMPWRSRHSRCSFSVSARWMCICAPSFRQSSA